MSSEVARREDAAMELHSPMASGMSSGLTDWAQGARAAAGIAQSIARTPFVPASLRSNDADVTAANVTAVILTGFEVGLKPMAALRSMDIIQGTPAFRAVALRGLAQSHGHDIELVESTATRCVMRGRRNGEQQWQSVQWDIDRARVMGLLGKDQWKKQPTAMLIARATSEVARLVAADVIMGAPYSIEELTDGATEAPPEVEPAARPVRSLKRAKAPATRGVVRGAPAVEDAVPEDEPDTDEADVIHEAEVIEQGDPITGGQLRALQAFYSSAGITDRTERLADVADILGRDVTSANDLTRTEASRVLDVLSSRGDTSTDADQLPISEPDYPEDAA